MNTTKRERKKNGKNGKTKTEKDKEQTETDTFAKEWEQARIDGMREA